MEHLRPAQRFGQELIDGSFGGQAKDEIPKESFPDRDRACIPSIFVRSEDRGRNPFPGKVDLGNRPLE